MFNKFGKQYFLVQENSLAVGACCWFIGLALSAVFYFTGLSRQTKVFAWIWE
jgi:hypothetical protein